MLNWHHEGTVFIFAAVPGADAHAVILHFRLRLSTERKSQEYKNTTCYISLPFISLFFFPEKDKSRRGRSKTPGQAVKHFTLVSARAPAPLRADGALMLF